MSTNTPYLNTDLEHDDGRGRPERDGEQAAASETRTSEPFILGDAMSQLGITPLGPDRDALTFDESTFGADGLTDDAFKE